MERLTIDGLFCDIMQCSSADCEGATDETQACDTKRVYEQLKAYEATGLLPSEVAELAKAKKERRLVVLPCTFDDIIYIARLGNLEIGEVKEVFKESCYNWQIRIKTSTGKVRTYYLDEFEQTYFLTREAAEAALGEREG